MPNNCNRPPTQDCTRSVTLQKDKDEEVKCCEPIEPLPCCVCDNKKPSALSVFICEHQREIQYGLAGLSTLALLVLWRAARAGRKFTNIQDIPGDYFEKGVVMSGRVHSVLPNGIMQVEHTPSGRMPWAATPVEEELLPVNLCAIAMTSDGQKWLEKKALHRTVWFKLIHQTPEYVDCSVRVRSGLSKVLINETLVKQGICRVADCTSMPIIYPHLLVRLWNAEGSAERRGVGMWSEETRRWWNPIVLLKRIFLWPYNLFLRSVKYAKYRDRTSV